jgi:hypothetical protein
MTQADLAAWSFRSTSSWEIFMVAYDVMTEQARESVGDDVEELDVLFDKQTWEMSNIRT